MRAIETRYAGHRFRSRLEARWAVFFDHLKIVWEYEPEGFVLRDGSCYLPDFYLPGLRLWAEVKGGDEALEDDVDRIQALADESGEPVLLLGDIAHSTQWMPAHSAVTPGGDPRSPRCAAALLIGDGSGDQPFRFVFFPDGGPLTTQAQCSIGWRPSCCIETAYMLARESRFEFGETPLPPIARPIGGTSDGAE